MRNESDGRDPRRQMSADELQWASLRAAPQVARMPRAGDSLGFALGIVAAIALGVVTWLWLSHQRQQVAAPVVPAPVQPALVAPPAPLVKPPPAAPRPPAPGEAKPETDAGKQSRGIPMIIDTTGVEAPAAPPKSHDAASASDAGKGKQGNTLSADEQFAVRIGDDAAPLQQAVALANPAATVVQGTIIPAVLETALDTDLPGYARAIVSRDVRGFDGTQVLIPRGSRLVGQYRSGIETGQSRAYVIWSRVIRPDGVSVQLGSPALDADGSTGLPGEVNRHFWQRYGASILLSVVGGAVSALGSDSSGTVVISSSTSSAASQALSTDGKIPPTIRIPLGTPIQVFTARDLDFAGY
jgi:type IV secretion system protein VirB10